MTNGTEHTPGPWDAFVTDKNVTLLSVIQCCQVLHEEVVCLNREVELLTKKNETLKQRIDDLDDDVATLEANMPATDYELFRGIKA